MACMMMRAAGRIMRCLMRPARRCKFAVLRSRQSPSAPIAAQGFGNPGPVGPCCFPPNALDFVFFAKRDQFGPSRRIIGAARHRSVRQGKVEPFFADIHPCTTGLSRARIIHLRRTCLVIEPKVPATYPGPEKKPVAITLLPSPKGGGALDPPTGILLRVATRSRTFLREPSCYTTRFCYNVPEGRMRAVSQVSGETALTPALSREGRERGLQTSR